MIKKNSKTGFHKTVMVTFCFAASLLLSSASHGTLLFDNLDQPPLGQGTISSSYFKAQKFTTDGSSCTLNWAKIRIRANTPGSLFAKIFNDHSNLPDVEVGSLTVPSIGPIYDNLVFTTSGTINLSGNRTYWVVVGVTGGTGAYDWNYTESNTGTGTGFSSRWAHSTDTGTTWKGYDTEPFMMQVDVTASPPVTLATGNPSSYKVTITKVEMYNGTSWVEVFSGMAQLDMVAGGVFPGINDLILPAGTYSQVRATFDNSFPVTGWAIDDGTGYYTTGATFGGQTNLASTPTTVAGSMAAFTFYNPAWGALNSDVTQTYSITPVTVGAATDYQPTLRFTISSTLLLKGTAGNPSSYFFSLDAPTGSLVEP